MSTLSLSARQKRQNLSRRPTAIAANQDLELVKEFCKSIDSYSTLQRRQVDLVSQNDFATLNSICENIYREEELNVMKLEVLTSVMNTELRAKMIKAKLSSKFTNEKEIADAVQQHKLNFSKELWARRYAHKEEMKSNFDVGVGTICKLGDIISSNSLELIGLFKRSNLTRICKDHIRIGLCEENDVTSYFQPKIFLLSPPIQNSPILVHDNRLGFQLQQVSTAGKKNAKPRHGMWNQVYATCGFSGVKVMRQRGILDMLLKTLDYIRTEMERINSEALTTGVSKFKQLSFVHLLARVLDVTHPSHQLQSTILMTPSMGTAILKRRLVMLDYKVNTPDEAWEELEVDHVFTERVFDKMIKKFANEQRFYWEFSVTNGCTWRIGVTYHTKSNPFAQDNYPGKDTNSYGFTSSGTLIHNDEEFQYISPLIFAQNPAIKGRKTIGVLVDLYLGNISLVVNGVIQDAAFGYDSNVFNEEQAEVQRNNIVSLHHIPTFSIQGCAKPSTGNNAAVEQHSLTVNFDGPFVNDVNAFSLNAIVELPTFQDSSSMSVVSNQFTAQLRILTPRQEEEIAKKMEEEFIAKATHTEQMQSFSFFPPIIRRRARAATTIQRAWRKYYQEKVRQEKLRQHWRAAVILQKAVRGLLRRQYIKKNHAAKIIQRNWRKTLFLTSALLRVKYQKPLYVLNRAAKMIQRQWRMYTRYEGSPLVMKYGRTLEELNQAATKIQRFWRPIHERTVIATRMVNQHTAARDIQRVYRGYCVRRRLHDQVREQLIIVAETTMKHRGGIDRMQAAYRIQKAWKKHCEYRILQNKIKTQHLAATRIRAVWMGYWVRVRLHTRFSYTQTLFLSGVRGALKKANFMLPKYKPTGLVCPKD